MHPAKARTPRRLPEEIRKAIESFLKASKQPAVIEPGDPPFEIAADRFGLEIQAGKLLMTVWDDSRSLTRKIVDIEDASHRARLELEIEKFGKQPGKLILADLQAGRNAALPRRGRRMTQREHVRKALLRQFLGWRVTELSSEPDLEHSLSPVYPRAWLRKGSQGIAAIAAPEAESAGGALTFGLIWLDYLRRREPKVATHSLAVFVPAGAETDTALRMQYLDRAKVACILYVLTPDGYEQRVEPREYTNLDTQLLPPAPPRDLDPMLEPDRLEAALREMTGVETVEWNDRSLSFRVRGLEVARRRGNEIRFGIETSKAATASHLSEIRELVKIVDRLRSAGSHPASLLYRRDPERWLESQVRARLEILEPSLCPEPVYGQAPAMAGVRKGRADRDVIDLLAIGRSGRLHVLELKASEDIHLPMQGLDYWIRVKGHWERGDFQGFFPAMTVSREAPKLVLVSPSLEAHPANETVIRYFSPEVETEQIGVGVEWRRELRVMFRRSWSQKT